MYHEVLNQTLLVQKYWGRLPIHFIAFKLMAPTKYSILKNERNVSLGFLKLVYVWFLSMTAQLSLSLCLSLCLSVFLCLCLSVSLPVSVSLCLSLSVSVSLCLSLCLSLPLSLFCLVYWTLKCLPALQH